MNLAAEMAKLPESPNDSKPPYWDAWRYQLWHLAQADNPDKFMWWPPIYHTMLQDHWRGSIDVEIQYLDGKGIPSMMELAINDARPDSSWYNLAHQTYHILRWQEVTGLRIADMQSVYEFGGGYGAMALVCNRLGFRGRYYIYDLPEFALLQQWYLGKHGVDNVEWVDKNYWNEVDLLLACYSLSETDFDERDRILRAIESESYLFLYSNKFEQYDNIEYFRGLEYGEWMVSNWRHERIAHLPPESWYTWGW